MASNKDLNKLFSSCIRSELAKVHLCLHENISHYTNEVFTYAGHATVSILTIETIRLSMSTCFLALY